MLIWFHDFHAAVPASVPMEYMQTLPQIVQISLLWKCIIHRPIYGLSLTVHELVSTSHWNLPAYQVMWNFINTEAWRPSAACAESPVWMAAEPSRVLAQGPQEVVSNNHVLFFFFFNLCLSKNGTCRYNPKNSAAKVMGFVKIPPSEYLLMKAVATVGPISVGIDTKHHSFQFYRGGKCFPGIIRSCASTMAHHLYVSFSHKHLKF